MNESYPSMTPITVVSSWMVCPKCAYRTAHGPFLLETKERCGQCGRKVFMLFMPDNGTIPVVDERTES